jgi:heme oxygenase
MLLWKLSASYTNFEKWTGEGDTKHLVYSFSNEKKMIETTTKGKYNAEETINEIFIDDKIIYDGKKPQKSKNHVDKDRSYYSTEYWKEQIKKHPLPKAINEQLIYVNESKNTYQ